MSGTGLEYMNHDFIAWWWRLSRKLEMEGDNISKIPEKALTISHEIHHCYWFNLIRACLNKQDILWCWWPQCWPVTRPQGAHTLHTTVTPERNLSPGCLAQTSRLQMINGGPKFRSEAPQSGGQRQGYCLLTVDMSWHYYRDKASWREYCPLCGSALWIFTGIDPDSQQPCHRIIIL